MYRDGENRKEICEGKKAKNEERHQWRPKWKHSLVREMKGQL